MSSPPPSPASADNPADLDPHDPNRLVHVRDSSKLRYDRYQTQRRARAAEKHPPHPHRAPRGDRPSKRQRTFLTLLGEFWKILGDQQRRVVAALVVTGIATALGLLPLYASKIVIDFVIDNRPRPDWLTGILGTIGIGEDSRRGLLLATIGFMMTITIVDLILTLWARWQATKAAKRTVVKTRRLAFDHAVRLPLHRVYDIKSGGVASILREDAGGVGDLVFSLLYNPSRAIIQLVGSLVILALIRWELLVGALLFLPVVWLTHRTWISRIRPLWRDVRTTRQGIDSHATEAFGGMRVVRTYGRQKGESAGFTEGNHLMTRQELFVWWWMRGIDSVWQVLIPAATAGLLLFGGLLGIRGGITAGDLTAFLAYLLGLLRPIAELANSATGLQNNLSGLDRTLDLLDEHPEFEARPDSKRVRRDETAGHVTFEDVHYAYPLQTGELGEGSRGHGGDVIRGVNLDVPAGTTVAFVGPSGAGKTTLCNLVARFFDPTAGRITLDGTDIRDIHPDDYRRLLGIVEQDTFLFDGTIAQNIAYGRRNATREDVIHAAKLANAHGFVSDLDGNYEALIGERGVKLSGGQRQRLTIARAILADPRILILDEATSNLDTESERLIQGSLAKLMRGRTCFVIAHRLSTIRNADLIAVVDGGRVAETGTHADLMARSGKYRHMVDLQTDTRRVDMPASGALAGA